MIPTESQIILARQISRKYARMYPRHADDILGAVFLKLCELTDSNNSDIPTPHLFVCLRNSIINALFSFYVIPVPQSAKTTPPICSSLTEYSPFIPSSTDTLDDLLNYYNLYGKDRVICRALYEGFTPKEIAPMANLKWKSVHSRIVKIRKKVKEKINA